MPLRIETLKPAVTTAEQRDLNALLCACVRGGASIGFLADIDAAEAEAYWSGVFSSVAAGAKLLLVARDESGSIGGSVQLALETRRNGRHRAEVQKLMVLPALRGRDLGTRLMGAVETRARERGVTLLFLDTSEGAGGARAFYEKLGYAYVGGIPGYALDPDGTPTKNAIYYKAL
ncbi:MAG TPA: GNAT family N-acetyltransferase [Opitutaceae bacterium]|nr:GNAT family N-acetyltransferase [Opitutaceae bacterium]